MNSNPPRVHTIELLESERVVPHGVAKQTWLVHVNGRFTPAHLVAGARVCQLQPEPGCVWARSIALELPSGTRLELVRETPRPQERKDVLHILTVDQRSHTQQRRTPHEITREGRIAPVKR